MNLSFTLETEVGIKQDPTLEEQNECMQLDATHGPRDGCSLRGGARNGIPMGPRLRPGNKDGEIATRAVPGIAMRICPSEESPQNVEHFLVDCLHVKSHMLAGLGTVRAI